MSIRSPQATEGDGPMRRQIGGALAVAVVLSLTLSMAALAAGPLKGKTYSGRTPASGVGPEGSFSFGVRLPVVLKVSASGKSVTASFPGIPEAGTHRAVMYCNIGVALLRQVTTPATISKGGSFQATILDKLSTEPGVPLKQIVTGRFNGHTVKGTVRTTTSAGCSGSTTYTATG
jgi:hypothetical protein